MSKLLLEQGWIRLWDAARATGLIGATISSWANRGSIQRRKIGRQAYVLLDEVTKMANGLSARRETMYRGMRKSRKKSSAAESVPNGHAQRGRLRDISIDVIYESLDEMCKVIREMPDRLKQAVIDVLAERGL